MKARSLLLAILLVSLSGCVTIRPPQTLVSGGSKSAATAPSRTVSTQVTSATYADVDCPGAATAHIPAPATCGVLTVPAHRDGSAPGTLRLFVTRVRPTHPGAASEPVLYLGGDLGVATDDVLLGQQVDGLGREIIALDARGSGRSQPSLVCPEVDSLPDPPQSVRVDDPRTGAE